MFDPWQSSDSLVFDPWQSSDSLVFDPWQSSISLVFDPWQSSISHGVADSGTPCLCGCRNAGSVQQASTMR